MINKEQLNIMMQEELSLIHRLLVEGRAITANEVVIKFHNFLGEDMGNIISEKEKQQLVAGRRK